MIQNLLSLLLAASITACPFVCKAGSPCCEHDAKAAAGCCDSCPAPGPEDQTPEPSDHNSDTPGTRDGCICAGAVIEDTALQHFDLVCCMWLALPAATSDAVAADFSPRVVDSLTLLPDNDTNQGRAMRCLISSFLC